jgi:hypothetical protein
MMMLLHGANNTAEIGRRSINKTTKNRSTVLARVLRRKHDPRVNQVRVRPAPSPDAPFARGAGHETADRRLAETWKRISTIESDRMRSLASVYSSSRGLEEATTDDEATLQ